ncbi:MAG: hypothetical protein E4H28_04920 [Gemmatimonadales bacterium]|nr:MAG: hypothetical protein E4H28_04920 [Gemmatimonadales bacterium]
MPLVDAYGGEVVAQATQNYAALRNHEDLTEAITAFETTGQLPRFNGSARKEEAMDEYMTPEEQKIRDLEQTVKRLESGLTDQSFASGKDTLERHMQDVFGEFSFSKEQQDRIRQTVVSQFSNWKGAGPAGVAALQGITGPNGKKTIRGIMLSDISGKDLQEAASNATHHRQQRLSRLSTDGPDGVASPGTEMRKLSEFDDLMEVAATVRANPDAFDSR